MKTSFSAVVVAVLALAVFEGCPSGPLEEEELPGATSESDDAGESEVSDGGVDAGEHDAGEVTPEDAGETVTRPQPGGCSAGYEYCGGNKVIGDSATLYHCNGAAEPTVVEKCERGCIVNPNEVDANDACVPARVASPVPGKSVTYAFGELHSRYRLGYHTGDDYATASGSYAVAVRSGTIRWSNNNGGDFGWWMALDADNGRTYVYAHLSRRLNVAGDKVLAGQVIALTGNTGLSTGPHLHFEDRPLGSTDNADARRPTW